MSAKSEAFSTIIHDNRIIIREAKPDLEEGLMFAHYLNEASEGFFKSMLGIKTNQIIAEAFIKSNNEYSFENVWMIEYQGKVVGMVSGYTHSEKEGFKKDILSQFHGERIRIAMFLVIGKLMARFLGPRTTGDYYIQGIAVSSTMRGKGLGQRLLNRSEEIAINKGAKSLSLDVSSKNKNAIKSYNKFGMRITSIWPNFLNLSPVFTRMEKEL